jgi:hypothetical protein
MAFWTELASRSSRRRSALPRDSEAEEERQIDDGGATRYIEKGAGQSRRHDQFSGRLP